MKVTKQVDLTFDASIIEVNAENLEFKNFTHIFRSIFYSDQGSIRANSVSLGNLQCEPRSFKLKRYLTNKNVYESCSTFIFPTLIKCSVIPSFFPISLINKIKSAVDLMFTRVINLKKRLDISTYQRVNYVFHQL